MRVTQKEIAEKLGTSQAHVARALSGNSTGRSRVSEETRLKIEQVAREMGYVFGDNRDARALAARRHGQRLKTGLIAVMYSVMGSDSPRNMPFFHPVVEGVENAAAERDLELCLCPVSKQVLPSLIRERNVDGVVSLAATPLMLEEMAKLELPFVTFHQTAKGGCGVTIDDQDGIYQTTSYLLAQGHRRIAYLGVKNLPRQHNQDRLNGYLRAMHEYGITVPQAWWDDSLLIPASTPQKYCSGCGTCAGCAGWGKLIRQNGGLEADGSPPFSALVCYNDVVAMGAIDHAQQDGVSVPHQLSVTGFDNLSLDYHFQPLITSVEFSRLEMGVKAVEILQEAISSPDYAVRESRVLFPATLRLHDSTRAFTAISAN